MPFKDVILREIWPFVVINKLSSIPSSSTVPTQTDDEPNSERDKLFDSITECCKFRIMGGGQNTRGMLLDEEVLKKPNINESLTPNMWLLVYLPKQKADSKIYHDRPLTIED